MSANNRSFFRLDVMMPCSYHIMSAEEAEAHPLPPTPDASYIEKYFLEDLTQIDLQLTEMIEKISTKSNILASALTALNTKINFMLQTIDEKHFSQAIPQKMVNLSAGGVSFTIDEPVSLSDKVDVLIQPILEEPPVLVRCTIVKILPNSDCENCATIALKFSELSEDDRRKLVFFIQKKEIEMANLNQE